MMKNIVTLLCFLAGWGVRAQNDSIVNTLEEVLVIADKNIKQNHIGHKIIGLNDSVILNNRESFTNLIRFNAPIYLKEYGSGGTSSARFRGTSASNTAVIWNGININSINNGQTGFNSLSVNLIDNIDIQSGGGSVKYGSGAIGGSIHLNTELKFGNFNKQQFFSSFGSYDTYQNLYKFLFGTSKISLNLGIVHTISDNDYKLLGTRYKNSNGAYENLNANFNFALRTSLFSRFSFYFSKFNGNREFSGELPNPTTAIEKYKDFNTRTLSVFNFSKNEYTHIVKAAYLTQEYRYFSDKNFKNYDFGKSIRSLFNYDFQYKIGADSKVETFSEYESTIGYTNKTDKHRRNQFSQSIIYSHTIKNVFRYNLKIRKDFNSDYTVPLIYAFGSELSLHKNIKLRLNGSKNYRVPSYNDLYWPELGNLNLIPESSLQYDFGLIYNSSQLRIDIGYFKIDSKDKIVWTPNANRQGAWTPINIASVENKGIELTTSLKQNIGLHQFTLNANYSYIHAKDKKNNSFLIFTPKHLVRLNLGYRYKKWSSFYQFLLNGKVYTSEDNLDSFSIPHYDISNIGIEYLLIKKNKKKLMLGLKLNNLFNEIYTISPRRIMPNRNTHIHINYKF
jgi:iron complex outermembrane receptor protein